jgi:hypothetical protein
MLGPGLRKLWLLRMPRMRLRVGLTLRVRLRLGLGLGLVLRLGAWHKVWWWMLASGRTASAPW